MEGFLLPTLGIGNILDWGVSRHEQLSESSSFRLQHCPKSHNTLQQNRHFKQHSKSKRLKRWQPRRLLGK